MHFLAVKLAEQFGLIKTVHGSNDTHCLGGCEYALSGVIAIPAIINNPTSKDFIRPHPTFPFENN
jgi:hypothetical protein